jgi:hypothetical protein
MEKLPFQFGLKAVFAAMTIVAALSAAGFYLQLSVQELVGLGTLGFVSAFLLIGLAVFCIAVGYVVDFFFRRLIDRPRPRSGQ